MHCVELAVPLILAYDSHGCSRASCYIWLQLNLKSVPCRWHCQLVPVQLAIRVGYGNSNWTCRCSCPVHVHTIFCPPLDPDLLTCPEFLYLFIPMSQSALQRRCILIPVLSALRSYFCFSLVSSVAAAAEAPSDRIFTRYLEWIQECKEAIHTLRMCIKQARAHREKCCSVLGAALGSTLALEQAVYSGTLHTEKAQELQRLCATVTAAIELAQQRVQVSCAPVDTSSKCAVLSLSSAPKIFIVCVHWRLLP